MPSPSSSWRTRALVKPGTPPEWITEGGSNRPPWPRPYERPGRRGWLPCCLRRRRALPSRERIRVESRTPPSSTARIQRAMSAAVVRSMDAGTVRTYARGSGGPSAPLHP